MKESQAIVQRARLLDGDYQRVDLAVAETLENISMGQCLLVRPKTMREQRTWHPYLRSVWYPVYSNRSLLTVEIHSAQRFSPGDVLDVIGPVGQNYRLRNTLRSVLLLAYDTPPFPLMMTIPHFLGMQVGVTLVLLGDAITYPTRHLPPEVEVIRGENPDDPLERQNQVTTIGWADQAFVVVPPGDEMAYLLQVWELFKRRRADVGRHYLYGVFQSVLPCGVGACEACAVRTKDGVKLACTDGPAFDLTLLF